MNKTKNKKKKEAADSSKADISQEINNNSFQFVYIIFFYIFNEIIIDIYLCCN